MDASGGWRADAFPPVGLPARVTAPRRAQRAACRIPPQVNHEGAVRLRFDGGDGRREATTGGEPEGRRRRGRSPLVQAGGDVRDGLLGESLYACAPGAMEIGTAVSRMASVSAAVIRGMAALRFTGGSADQDDGIAPATGRSDPAR